ncbi:MAG: hypothetical protein ACFFD4_24035 [Candidatus Odinarchaeota archaeon]
MKVEAKMIPLACLYGKKQSYKGSCLAGVEIPIYKALQRTLVGTINSCLE